MRRLKFLFLLICICFSSLTLQAQWEVQFDLEDNIAHLDRIFFLDENYGWAIGGATIGLEFSYFYTTDGGENWYWGSGAQGTDIWFVNQDTGFIAAADGIVKKTTDGGQSWTDIQTPATQNVIRLFFVDENNGWATLDSGNLLHTSNGGDNWEIITTSLSYITDLFVIEEIIWCSGFKSGYINCIISSTDNGENWQEKYSNSSNRLLNLFFVDSQTGWAVGENDYEDTAVVIKTNDGGATWEEQSVQPLSITEPDKVNCVYFVNDTTGWIGVGKIQDPGAIYFTEDGGENWQLQQYLMSAVLDIQLFDCNNGWAVGGDYIYHSSNASIITSAKERTPTGHDITVTPNPGSGVFYVEGENIPLNGEPCQLILRNSTGTHKRTWHTSHLNHYKIDISGKPAGVYFLTVQFPSNNQMHSFTQKIIKL